LVPDGLGGFTFSELAAFDQSGRVYPFSWIEDLATRGITAGCGSGVYCPTQSITRAQMAVILLKTLLGANHQPPPAQGTVFADVPADSFAAAWIEDLAARQITGGCLINPLRYCPGSPTNRARMAIFLVKTFGIP
jgi:hypothetical protein